MPMRFIAAIVMGILAGPFDGHAASACRAESGAKLVPLVELYTSEGCDSCPAADRWLSMHFPAGRPGDAIALAFHVDYWDRLGWKDRFASPAYTARQSDAMRANRAKFVYTPQVVLQGRDFTGWRRGSPKDAIATLRHVRRVHGSRWMRRSKRIRSRFASTSGSTRRRAATSSLRSPMRTAGWRAT